MKDLRERTSSRLIPIYSMRLLLVVTDDVERSRAARNHIYGEPINDSTWAGLCVHSGFRTALIFDRSCLCHALIAHEVFHLTHRILEYCNVAFGRHNHEPFACLCGWITGAVYSDLGKMGERIRGNYPARTYLKREPRLNLNAPVDF